MKTIPWIRNSLLAAVTASLLTSTALAFPPAPHHNIYGMVRDQFGNPLTDSSIQIQLVTPAGNFLTANINAGIWPGANYQLAVPMDAGITPDIYESNALVSATSFKMFVVIGSTTNVPFQMLGDYSRLGQPGKQTKMDLTLGQDLNGDGLPDAWEYAILAAYGGSLSGLTAGTDSDRDGMSNWAEFIAGTYAFDPTDTLSVKIVSMSGNSPLLEFLAISGHTYSVLGSADLKSWTTLSVQSTPDPASPSAPNFYATSTASRQHLQVVQPTSGTPFHFFKMMVQ